MTTIDADTAKALAGFKGAIHNKPKRVGNLVVDEPGMDICLRLHGLTTLDAATAKALAGSKAWDVRLPNLATLDAEAAKTLAAAQKWDGQLPKLTTLDSPDSIAVAQALATRKGPLSLPNLEKISPKTLTVLIEKQDVEIPLIETLEFIPEPDGSGNDDFVIPEWLEERQMRRAR